MTEIQKIESETNQGKCVSQVSCETCFPHFIRWSIQTTDWPLCLNVHEYCGLSYCADAKTTTAWLRPDLSRNEWLLRHGFLLGESIAAVIGPGFPLSPSIPVTVGCRTTRLDSFLGRRGLLSRPSRQLPTTSHRRIETAFVAWKWDPQLLRGRSIELLPSCWFPRMRTKTSKDSGQWVLRIF